MNHSEITSTDKPGPEPIQVDSVGVVEQGETVEETSDSHIPDASMLEDRFPEWAQMSRSAALWTTIVGFIYAVLNYHRLWYTDLWVHLAYGRVIVESKSIPATKPLLPLCEGMPFFDTAWLSQVLSYLMYEQFGVTSLRFLYALALTICVVAMLVRFRQKTNSYGLSLIGLAVFGFVAWKTLSIIRPQIAGFTCFVLVWTLVSCHKWTKWHWGLVPAIFLVWANLHGSFPVGLGLIGLLWIGKTADQFIRTKRMGAWASLRYFVMLELCLLAVLINPYGIGIFSAIHSISGNPNLSTLVEWEPLTLRMAHGQAMVIVGVLLIILHNYSPRRVSISEFLILIVFAIAGMWSVRMVVWWTPLAALSVVIHGQAILNRYTNWKSETQHEPHRSGLNTVVALGMSWIFFAYTPFGATLLHGYPQEPEKALDFYRSNLSSQTPVLLANYLNEHEPDGLIFNTYEWGDYLLWTGPQDRQLFLNSHAHLVPRDVWLDYFVIARANLGWEDKIDRYGANTVVIDKLYHSRLLEALKRNSDWKLDYEDELGAIFFRRNPILTGPIIK